VDVTPVSPDLVAREANTRIRAQCRRFAIAPTDVVAFVCECGCFAEVESTLAAYDGHEGPLLAPGHRPPRGGVVADLFARLGQSRSLVRQLRRERRAGRSERLGR
jgi:hypothetical protein